MENITGQEKDLAKFKQRKNSKTGKLEIYWDDENSGSSSEKGSGDEN